MSKRANRRGHLAARRRSRMRWYCSGCRAEVGRPRAHLATFGGGGVESLFVAVCPTCETVCSRYGGGYAGRKSKLGWRAVLCADVCPYCGHMPGGTIEHVEARVKGGRDIVENIVGACGVCNGEKGHVSMLGYLLFRATRGAVTIGGVDPMIR